MSKSLRFGSCFRALHPDVRRWLCPRGRAPRSLCAAEGLLCVLEVRPACCLEEDMPCVLGWRSLIVYESLMMSVCCFVHALAQWGALWRLCEKMCVL